MGWGHVAKHKTSEAKKGKEGDVRAKNKRNEPGYDNKPKGVSSYLHCLCVRVCLCAYVDDVPPCG